MTAVQLRQCNDIVGDCTGAWPSGGDDGYAAANGRGVSANVCAFQAVTTISSCFHDTTQYKTNLLSKIR